MSNELQTFLNTWDEESKKTVAMLKALPAGQYDFRPDAGGRSLGELAWHLAEMDAYTDFGLERGAFEMGVRPPGIERPKTVEELAPGYERIHKEAMRQSRKADAADLDRKLLFFTGDEIADPKHPVVGVAASPYSPSWAAFRTLPPGRWCCPCSLRTESRADGGAARENGGQRLSGTLRRLQGTVLKAPSLSGCGLFYCVSQAYYVILAWAFLRGRQA